MRKTKKVKEFIDFIVESSKKGITDTTITYCYIHEYKIKSTTLNECMQEAKKQGVSFEKKTTFDGNLYLNKNT